MVDVKTLFKNPDLKTGGFYELSIQVCPSIDQEPIQLYTDYVWSLTNVDGPYDYDFNRIGINIEQFEHQGILTLNQYLIPFKTYNIRETEPVETGFNWFDICFYTTAIEHVFGPEYQTWTEVVNPPPLLHNFLVDTMKKLNALFPFELAMIDFEVSGMYYLKDLQAAGVYYPHAEMYVNRSAYGKVNDEYKSFVRTID